MSTKLINSEKDVPRTEVSLQGVGTATLALFDAKGNALLTKRLVISGSENVGARSRLPLSLGTKAGHVAVVPVLIHQTSLSQKITFGGKDPAGATAQRFQEMKLDKSAITKIQAKARLAAELIGKQISDRSSIRRG